MQRGDTRQVSESEVQIINAFSSRKGLISARMRPAHVDRKSIQDSFEILILHIHGHLIA